MSRCIRWSVTVNGADLSSTASVEFGLWTGRENPLTQPGAGTITMTFYSRSRLPELAADNQLSLRANLTGLDRQVWAGTIAEITRAIKWRTDPNTGHRYPLVITQLTAAGPLALLNHRRVGQHGYPLQFDGERVAAALTDADAPIAAGPDYALQIVPDPDLWTGIFPDNPDGQWQVTFAGTGHASAGDSRISVELAADARALVISREAVAVSPETRVTVTLAELDRRADFVVGFITNTTPETAVFGAPGAVSTNAEISADPGTTITLDTGTLTIPAGHRFGRVVLTAESAAADGAAIGLDWISAYRQGIDPGVADVIARDPDQSAAAITVVQSAAQSAGGAVWETRHGKLTYADRDHRIAETGAGIVLDATQIDAAFTLRQDGPSRVNRAIVSYGAAPESGSKQSVTVEDPESIAAAGEYTKPFDTELADESEALALAEWIVTTRKQPKETLDSVTISLRNPNLPPWVAELLLTASPNELIDLRAIPRAIVETGRWRGYIEGTKITGRKTGDSVTLRLSDALGAYYLIKWREVPENVRWNRVERELRWDDVRDRVPIDGSPQWSDVPADLQWHQTDPAQTWNTFAREKSNA